MRAVASLLVVASLALTLVACERSEPTLSIPGADPPSVVLPEQAGPAAGARFTAGEVSLVEDVSVILESHHGDPRVSISNRSDQDVAVAAERVEEDTSGDAVVVRIGTLPFDLPRERDEERDGPPPFSPAVVVAAGERVELEDPSVLVDVPSSGSLVVCLQVTWRHQLPSRSGARVELPVRESGASVELACSSALDLGR